MAKNYKTRSIPIKVSSEIGKVSAVLMTPADTKCVMTLAHGAGAGMHHEFMELLSEALAGHNIATLRFNFPFMENKKRRPDSPATAHKTIEAAIAKTHELFPSLPLFVSGKSFGGRMSSQLLATQKQTVAKGLVFYGFPLHPAGKPSTDRAEHLKDVTVPMLFLQGTRDELATFQLIEEVCTPLKLATLYKIEGANHAFKAGKQDVIALLATATGSWIDKQLRKS